MVPRTSREFIKCSFPVVRLRLDLIKRECLQSSMFTVEKQIELAHIHYRKQHTRLD